MKRKKNENYGIDALENEGYVGFKKFISQEKNNGESLITKPYIYIPMTLGLSCVDGLVLYSLTNIAMQQSALMGYLMALAIAIVLNVLPLVMAKYIHHMIYRTKRFALLAVMVCIVAFTVLFGTTVGLRYEYRDLYGEGSTDVIINKVSDDDETDTKVEEISEDTKAMAVFWLLALEPLATSIMNLMLGLMGDNDMKKRIQLLKLRRIELQEEKSDCEAALADMNLEIERMLRVDDEKSRVMKDEIKALRDTLKAVSRQILAEELGDPSSISKLCGEMIEDEPELEEEISSETELEMIPDDREPEAVEVEPVDDADLILPISA